MQCNLNEQTLLARIQAGEQAAVGELYDCYAGLLYGLALRITGNSADAEEVVLDVFTQVWRHACRYDPARGSVRTWLVTIARSRALDRRQPLPDKREGYQAWLDDAGRQLEEVCLQALHMRTLLARLPGEQRQVLVLAFYQGMTHHEIAAHLGEPLGTVKTRARLGLQKLRAWLLTPVLSGAKGCVELRRAS